MSGKDAARTLYPFLYSTEDEPGELAGVLAEARDSALGKCRDVVALRRSLLGEYAMALVHAAGDMTTRFAAGATLIAFGNGGSATDARDAVADCVSPPLADWRTLPAISLAEDGAVLTAIANDVGVDAVFTRQLNAFGGPFDIALGISTSGNSRNVNAALREATRMGMLTIGFTGGDGGALARETGINHCFVARTDYIPRIQEGHATLWHALLELVQARLALLETRS